MINADPSLDFGAAGADIAPGLRSCLAVPLVEGTTLVAVLALYRDRPSAFSEDDARLIELLAPRLASSLAHAVAVERGATTMGSRVVAEAGSKQLAVSSSQFAQR